MTSYPVFTMLIRKSFVPMAAAMLWSMSGAAMAVDVTGSWDTTALTRITVKTIGYSDPPSNSADITDGNYYFDSNGTFQAGDIQGTWSQPNAKYSIRPDPLKLINDYYTELTTSTGPDDPVVKVNGIRLLGTPKLSGLLLTAKSPDPNQPPSYSLWGDESYVYRLDVGEGDSRQILRVTMTVRVAGLPTPPTPAALSARVVGAPKITSAQLAAAAVKKHLAKTDRAAQ